MRRQNWLYLHAPIFHAYFWRFRWCVVSWFFHPPLKNDKVIYGWPPSKSPHRHQHLLHRHTVSNLTKFLIHRHHCRHLSRHQCRHRRHQLQLLHHQRTVCVLTKFFSCKAIAAIFVRSYYRSFNPDWHEAGHFPPLVLFGSDFFSWIFIKNFQTFL